MKQRTQINQPHSRRWGLLVLFVVWTTGASTWLPSGLGQEELNRREKQLVRSIASDIGDCRAAVEKQRLPQAVRAFGSAIAKLSGVSREVSPALARELQEPLADLAKLRDQLMEAEVQVPEIPAIAAPQGSPSGVSFQKEVAGILVSRCGNCHVRGTRGDFGMRDFAALTRSGMVVAKDPVSSRLIQVIDSGEMPKGGGMVSDRELAVLRKWIEEGATNDGDDDMPLQQMAAGGGEDNPGTSAAEPLALAMANGEETVSFSGDIAPVLLQECAGCHLDTMRVRGGLNMSDFISLLRGGDSGPMLNLKEPGESLLVKKLRGTGGGNRMPGGRPPLADEVIATIEKWIAEGAKFDGTEPRAELRRVAAEARAATLSHADLARDRARLADGNWKRALPTVEAQRHETRDLMILSTMSGEAFEEWTETAGELANRVRQALDLAESDPLVKGKLTVFLFVKRYDFNELSVMVEGHALPKDSQLFWKYDMLDAYVSVLIDRTADRQVIEEEMARGMAAAAVAGMAADVPRWFAEGMGYVTAAELFPKSDSVKRWQAEAVQVADEKQEREAFRKGEMAEAQAALAGYYFVAQLKSTPQFKRLFRALQSGANFDEAMTEHYGKTSDELLGGARPRNSRIP